MGFDVTNEIFAENSWYFRNALVRANYNDISNNIHETTEYLEIFLRNLILGEKNELQSRYLHIRWKISEQKPDIGTQKPDIKLVNVTDKTKNHINLLLDTFGENNIFGRSDVKSVTGLESSRASELIALMLDREIIKPVKGHGKGKYKFVGM